MQTIEDLITATPALSGLAPEHVAVIAGCGRNDTQMSDTFLLREGEQEDVFFIVRRGTVALEAFVPQRGPVTVQTLHDGDLLGWSWLIPPYRTAFDAHVLETTHVVKFDAACLRSKIDADPALGYDLLRAFVPVMVERLQSTRLQLLDVYAGA